MNGETQALLAALAIGLFAGAVVALVVRPTRRLASRVRPYTTVARVSLGQRPDLMAVGAPAAPLPPNVLWRLFGPPATALGRALGSVLDLGKDEELRLKLRQAGYEVGPDEYRVRQLGATVLGGASAAVVGIAVRGSPALVLLLAVAGLVSGAARGKGMLERTIDARRQRMRIELYTVNQLLAM
ncbi:MAG: hypothetical protein ACRDKW_17260, partial [Actinomycetota bacterium]